jgi:hypothetical protein
MPDELFFRIAGISIIFMQEKAVRIKRMWREKLAKNETTV